ncbi:MAG: RNA polymerase sigma factor [Brevundimonas sp.]|nr:RNA polymerase sigma factor [Brevundimonas sp.]
MIFQVICRSVGECAVVSEGLEQMEGEGQASLSELYKRYAAWFRARLVRRYGAQDAEDLLQETWLRLTPYREAREIQHPQALLMRIATNLAADMSARQLHRTRHASEISQSHGWGYEMPAQADELLAKQLVLGLPVPLRDVFVLSRFGGLTNSQIAEQLGISPKTVEWRMTKALAHCAAQLRR